MPSAGIGLGSIILLGLFLLLVLFCCHCCGCINVSMHRRGNRKRRGSGDSVESRRRHRSSNEALQEMKMERVVEEMKQMREDARQRDYRPQSPQQQPPIIIQQQAPHRQQYLQPQIEDYRHEPLALAYQPERHNHYHHQPHSRLVESTSFSTPSSSSPPRHRDPPVYGTLPKVQATGLQPSLQSVHRPVVEQHVPYPHPVVQHDEVRQHRVNDAERHSEEATQTASQSEQLKEETRAMLRS